MTSRNLGENHGRSRNPKRRGLVLANPNLRRHRKPNPNPRGRSHRPRPDPILRWKPLRSPILVHFQTAIGFDRVPRICVACLLLVANLRIQNLNYLRTDSIYFVDKSDPRKGFIATFYLVLPSFFFRFGFPEWTSAGGTAGRSDFPNQRRRLRGFVAFDVAFRRPGTEFYRVSHELQPGVTQSLLFPYDATKALREDYEQLLERYQRAVDDVAALTAEKQHLEHLVLQLQSETETIGPSPKSLSSFRSTVPLLGTWCCRLKKKSLSL